jgi:hypothetical protein
MIFSFPFSFSFVMEVLYMSYGGASKSMFSNRGGSYFGSKSIINPVKSIFSQDVLASLNGIEKNYTANLAGKSYSSIPGDYVEYSKLYTLITNLQLSVLDSSIAILLKITKEGLMGAMNSLGLSNQLLEANVAKIILQNQVNQLESGLNQLNIYSNTSGQYQISKTFTLIPLYSYYILLYGLPQQGVGFDPLKVTQLLKVLEANNIDPYNE